jgi:hypothetical protein
LTTANGTTSILTVNGQNALNVDVTNAAADLTLVTGQANASDEWLNNSKFSVTTTNNNSTLYAGGRFSPGFQAQTRASFLHAPIDNTPAHVFGKSFIAAYVSGGASVVDNMVANYTDSTHAIIKTRDRAAANASIGVGGNWQPGPSIGTFGLGVTGTHNWATPLAQKPVQVCVSQATGKTSTGKAISASQCDNRYFGVIRNLNSGEARVDYVSPRLAPVKPMTAMATTISAAIGSVSTRASADSVALAGMQPAVQQATDGVDVAVRAIGHDGNVSASAFATYHDAVSLRDRMTANAAAVKARFKARGDTIQQLKKQQDSVLTKAYSKPTIAFIGAAAADPRDRSRTSYSLSVGPGLFAPLMPDKIYGALLFELNDFTNASGQVPSFGNRFAVRLVVGVPFQ